MALMFRHAGHVDDKGMLHLRSVAAWRAAIARHRERDVWLCIGRASPPKTREQMGYYRGVVLPLLAEEWGWDDRDELHFRLKEKHIPRELWTKRRLGAEELCEPPSSADLTQEQFSEFLTAVITQATHDGIVVPEPHRVEQIA